MATEALMRIRRTFGAQVRRLRVAKGWHLDDLGGPLQKSRASMSRIETGKQNLTLADMVAIANMLGVELPVLLGAKPDQLSLEERRALCQQSLDNVSDITALLQTIREILQNDKILLDLVYEKKTVFAPGFRLCFSSPAALCRA